METRGLFLFFLSLFIRYKSIISDRGRSDQEICRGQKIKAFGISAFV